jgi:hypothetical protein
MAEDIAAYGNGKVAVKSWNPYSDRSQLPLTAKRCSIRDQSFP